jgi:ketose-bisphosphate aldolase
MTYADGSHLIEVYQRARMSDYGFIASNLTHPDILQGLLRGAETADSDLVLQIKRDTAEYFGNGDIRAGLKAASAHISALSTTMDNAVFLNVDHIEATDRAMIDAALDVITPSSIMIDASERPLKENIEKTRQIVDRVEQMDANILVEAELGTIAGTESGEVTKEALYTDPTEAVEFVDQSGCDLLAISIGTKHGVAAGVELDLRVELATEIGEALRQHGLEIPLVVHGSSGLTQSQVTALMETDVCKLNTNTRYQYELARRMCEYCEDHREAIMPPPDTTDTPSTMFAGHSWQPDKTRFRTHAFGDEVHRQITEVYSELATLSGSAGQSRAQQAHR